MAQTTTQVGRMKLEHPDRGFDTSDRGVALHAAIASIYTQLSNHVSTRYFSVTLDDTQSQTLTHNFGMDLASLTVAIYNGSTYVQTGSSATWTLAQIDANTVSITNNSGGTATVQVNIVGLEFGSVLGGIFATQSYVSNNYLAKNTMYPGLTPLGGMVAVMPTTHANAWQPGATGVIKDGFMRADGHVITAQNVTDGCVFPAGTTLPNMIAKYPRGNTTSGTTGGSNTQASNVTLSSHSITQPVISAHSVTQPAFSNHAITQPGFNAPGHYHGFSGGTALSGGGHTHDVSNFDGLYYRITSTTGGSQRKITYLTDGTPTGYMQAVNSTGASHGHSGNIGYGSGGVSGDSAFACSRSQDVQLSAHALSTNVAVGNHTLTTNVGVSDHTVTNNTVNNEPAYVEVVWVIRVM